MSSSYSANQYDSAFKPQRLNNWCETKRFRERPTAHEGHTTFIADERGHLLPGVVKRGNAWREFKETGGQPARIPGYRINPTGRSVEGLNRLKSWGFEPLHTSKSQPHTGSKKTDGMQDAGEQTNMDEEQDGAASSSVHTSAAEARHWRTTTSQNQDLQAVVFGSDTQPDEDKQAVQDTE